MEAASFDEANVTMGPSAGTREDQVRSIRVHRSEHENVYTACFKPTQAELDEIQRTGRVWLQVLSSRFPPVLLRTDNPFA